MKAQKDHYSFEQLDVSKGLSNSRVKCFLKDSQGFIWIGTFSGLNRFDGYRVKVFLNNPRDTASLVDNEIEKLFEDPEGNIWIDTWNGLNIYNPKTEMITRNTAKELRRYSILPGELTDITKDSDGNFWFVHSTFGIFKYMPSQKRTEKIEHIANDTTSLSTHQIAALKEDVKGDIWIMHRNGVIEMMDRKTLKIKYRNTSLYKEYSGAILDYNLLADSDGDLWINIDNNNKGLYYLNRTKNSLQHIYKNSPVAKISSDIVRWTAQDDQGLIWVATDHGGINIINKKDFSVRYILNIPDDDQSLVQNSINTLYKDRDGFLWAGTFKKGVSYYHENAIRFKLYKQLFSNPSSLPYSDVNCFAEDEKGNLWIGTNGGGLVYYDRKNETYKQYLFEANNPSSLSNDVIISLCIDHNKKLWVGTYFGGLNQFDGKRFIRYKHDPVVPGSLSDDNIWEIFEDSQNRLWIGTLAAGLDLYQPINNSFKHFKVGEPNSINSTYVPTIAEDKEGNLWFGTYYGVDVMDRQGQVKHYLNDVNDRTSLSSNGVNSVLCDSYGMMWIGTKDGINVFDSKTNSFRSFRVEDGLSHNSISTILEDDSTNIWLGTLNGISQLVLKRGLQGEIKSFEFRNFDESDGLQGKQFSDGAAFKTSKGELIFGGSNGFNLFHPKDVVRNEQPPKIILSDFQIFNKSVKTGEVINGQEVLKQSISLTKEITLNHSDNIFSIEFAALSFFHPEKSLFKYRLDGFSSDWLITDGSSRKVTYTNLDAGEYTFRVLASNNDGVWNSEGLKIKIIILPPFWKTKTAFFIYTLLFLGALLLSRQMILQRERIKYRIEKERQEANQLHELDMMKIKFFTNVSHEFRTPLSLILAPIEKVLKSTHNSEHENQFQMIYRNAKRLLNLVNQLLDLRKMEVQEIKLNPSEGDIITFIIETSNSFSDLSEKKSIEFSVRSSVTTVETIFDKDKLEKILFNLLSNAFKFTPEHGKVSVDLALREKESDTRKWLDIKVSDTGIGIPKEKHDKIFERFFQNDLPKSMVNQGSGIGLSITSEFVKAHEGTISVESEPNKGSCFTISIPLPEINATEIAPIEDEDVALSIVEPELISSEDEPIEKGKSKIPTLLLVEDNEDFRFYLKDNLKLHYEIIEARNGKEGLSKTIQYLPDLIVSDVMMPEMNGIEFCKRVKNEKTISHIPVILLTARSAEEQKLEGFEVGADDYITKPFNFEILQFRIKNLIHQRELFHQDFRKQIEIKGSDIKITSLDEKLIQNAITLVEDNIGDPDFSVEHLSKELGMSRVHLYKKLLSLTGKAPLEFIRVIRLQRAAQLLEKSQLTVAEVAYKVGFNNPKYFTKYFKEEYKMLPSVFASSKRNDKV